MFTLTDQAKANLDASIKALSDAVDGLVPDPVPNPLQVALDAANAQVASLKDQLAGAVAAAQAANAKIAKAQADLA